MPALTDSLVPSLVRLLRPEATEDELEERIHRFRARAGTSRATRVEGTSQGGR